MGMQAELLERDSDALGRSAAATGLLRGGLAPGDVTEAVRRTGARVVHAHNVHPTLGWRALAAARDAGARVVLHLHNYRLVCAVGTCFTHGADCPRCHGRGTRPGGRLHCRGSRAEAVTYAAGLSLWQRRLTDAADALVVPSEFALNRLRALGAPVDGARVLPSVQREIADRSRAGEGEYVLAAGRLTPEKGFADVVRAAKLAELPLVVAGDGPELAALRDEAPEVRFVGRVSPERLAELRARAAVAGVPPPPPPNPPPAALEAVGPRLPRVPAAPPGPPRWLHWRRWPPGPRSSPRAPGASPTPSRRKACTNPATSARSRSGSGSSTPTPVPASARCSAPASAMRRASSRRRCALSMTATNHHHLCWNST